MWSVDSIVSSILLCQKQNEGNEKGAFTGRLSAMSSLDRCDVWWWPHGVSPIAVTFDCIFFAQIASRLANYVSLPSSFVVSTNATACTAHCSCNWIAATPSFSCRLPFSLRKALEEDIYHLCNNEIIFFFHANDGKICWKSSVAPSISLYCINLPHT